MSRVIRRGPPTAPVSLTAEDQDIIAGLKMWAALMRDQLYGKDWENMLGMAYETMGHRTAPEYYPTKTHQWRLAFNVSPAPRGWIANHPLYGD